MKAAKLALFAGILTIVGCNFQEYQGRYKLQNFCWIALAPDVLNIEVDRAESTIYVNGHVIQVGLERRQPNKYTEIEKGWDVDNNRLYYKDVTTYDGRTTDRSRPFLKALDKNTIILEHYYPLYDSNLKLTEASCIYKR